MILDPEKAAGKTSDLKGSNWITMWGSDHECRCGETTLTQSSYRTYCHRCGVWWWNREVDQCETSQS